MKTLIVASNNPKGEGVFIVKKFIVVFLSSIFLFNTIAFAQSLSAVEKNKLLMDQLSPTVVQAKVLSIGSLRDGERTCKFQIVASYDRVWGSLSLTLQVPSNLASTLKKNKIVMLYLEAFQPELVSSPYSIVTSPNDINEIHKELITYRTYRSKAELEENVKQVWLNEIVKKLSYFSDTNDLRYNEFYAGHTVDAKGRPTIYYRKEFSLPEAKKIVRDIDKNISSIRWVAVKYSYNQLASVREQLEAWEQKNPNVLGFSVNFVVNTSNNKVTVFIAGNSSANQEKFRRTVFDNEIIQFADLSTMVQPK